MLAFSNINKIVDLDPNRLHAKKGFQAADKKKKM